LTVRGSDAQSWLSRFGTTLKGSLQSREFCNALDALDIIESNEGKQGYFEDVIDRTNDSRTGEKPQILSVDKAC
jgi:hypothetical protein